MGDSAVKPQTREIEMFFPLRKKRPAKFNYWEVRMTRQEKSTEKGDNLQSVIRPL